MKRTETLLLTSVNELPRDLNKLISLFQEIRKSVAKEDRDTIRIGTEIIPTSETLDIVTNISYEREETELEAAKRVVSDHHAERNITHTEIITMKKLMVKYEKEAMEFISEEG